MLLDGRKLKWPRVHRCYAQPRMMTSACGFVCTTRLVRPRSWKSLAAHAGCICCGAWAEQFRAIVRVLFKARTHCADALIPLCRGPTRLGALNDSRRMTTLKMGVAEALRSAGLESRGLPCLSLSDGSVPALVAAELGATSVYTCMNWAWYFVRADS